MGDRDQDVRGLAGGSKIASISLDMRALRFLCLAVLVAVPASAGAEADGGDAAKPAESTRKPAKAKLPPYRLVRILPETNQALLLDKNKGKHVLVDVGDAVGAYQVIEIDTDQVVLGKTNETREYVLVAGEATPTTRVSDPYPIPKTETGLRDPYPDDVLDPYGSGGVREVQAPENQRAKEDIKDPYEEPTVTKAPDPTPETRDTKPAPVKETLQTEFTVVRKELSAALSDFGKIGKDLQLTVVEDGVSIDTVSSTSFFYKMGLRDGDLVKKVDGKVIKSLDDAATVYARMGKMKKFTVELVRGGETLTLRYQITK
jgi:type II secretory pathway component PulC